MTLCSWLGSLLTSTSPLQSHSPSPSRLVPVHHITSIKLISPPHDSTPCLIFSLYQSLPSSFILASNMSTVKQESLNEQRGVKSAREVDTNLTDELVYCIDKARLAQRYLGIRPQPLLTGEGGASPVPPSSGSTSPPYHAEQNVVFVAFQCESKGRIEKPQAGEKERIHDIKISVVDSAIRKMKRRGRNAEGRLSEGWHWQNGVIHEHPTQMSRFQRHESIEKSKTIRHMSQLPGKHWL